MKTQIATDKEQSARLLACGVKPETADMRIRIEIPKNQEPKIKLQLDGLVGYEHTDPKKTVKIIPAWSLSALLALLPKEINDTGMQTTLSINANADSGVWSIDYYDYYMDGRILYQEATDPIEACVRAIIWLLSNGYSINNIEQ